MTNTPGIGDHVAEVTTDAAGVPTKTPQPKVVAGTVGAGVGAAVSEIGIWLVESTAHIDIPGGVEAAIVIVVTAALGFVAGYLKRPSADAS
jgi:hypothetical protein